MKLSRLRGRKPVAYLLRKGEVWQGKTMRFHYLQKAPWHPEVDPTKPGLYVGTIASTKLNKSAVKRNRMRRRCREALRKAVINREKIGPVQLLIAPRSSSLTCDSSVIAADVAAFLTSIS